MSSSVTVYPCVFCAEENSHARAYPVAGDPELLYCPTCKMMFDVSELEVESDEY